MRTKLYQLMKKRLEVAYSDPSVWSDMAYGLRKLVEADPPLVARGRVETLQDLLRRSEAAESSHSPQVIKDLVAALNTFLDEELAEASRVRAKAHDGKSEAETCESCGHKLEDALGDAGGDRVCAHCGHPVPSATESNRPSKLTCSVCKHSFTPKSYEAGGIAACPKCSAPVVTYETESDDPEELYFMPYDPIPEDESEDESEDEDEVHAMRHHTKSKHRRRETSRAVETFRRALRGDMQRPARGLSAVEIVKRDLGEWLPPREYAAPRPLSGAAAKFHRSLHGDPVADRADRLAAAGKSAARVFKILMADPR